MKINNKTVDPETIYQRVMGIQMSERTLDYKEVFSTELNTFAPSLFNDDGTMRLIEDKSKLKRDIQVTIPARCVPKPLVLIVDVSQLLWVLEWPKSGRLEFIVIIFKKEYQKCYKNQMYI